MFSFKIVLKELLCALFLTGLVACGGDNGVSQRDDSSGFDLECPEEEACVVYSPKDNTLKDFRDNRVYPTVKIGNQIWMAENLSYKVKSNSWCYEDKSSNCDKYGRLYTWAAAAKSCPTNWRLPSDSDWSALIENAGGFSLGGEVLKSFTGWNENGNGLDTLGFSAMPGGNRDNMGRYHLLGFYAFFWSSETTNSDSTQAIVYRLSNEESSVGLSRDYKESALSVRCMKDDI